MLLHGLLKNGLYELKLPSSSSSQQFLVNNVTASPCSSCNTQTLLALLYSRLSHPHQVILNKVLSKLKIKVSSHSNMMFCDACQYCEYHDLWDLLLDVPGAR